MRQKVVVWFLAKGNQWPKADAEWLGELSAVGNNKKNNKFTQFLK